MNALQQGPAHAAQPTRVMTVPSRGMWPGAIIAFAWIGLGATLLYAYRPGGPLDLLLPAILALPLAALGTLAARAARRDEAGPHWGLRLALATGVALLVAALVLTPTDASRSMAAWPDLDVRRLLPGPGQVWAFLAAAVLTVGATTPWRGEGLARPVAAVMPTAAALVISAMAGGAALAWNASILVPAVATAAGCGDQLTVPMGEMRSSATGELDGAPLGRVDVRRGADRPVLIVEYDTRWGAGGALLPGSAGPHLDPLETVTLAAEARLTADDLGIDLVRGRAVRHCQLIIDGRSAVHGFAALRWLVGEDERTVDPGRGLTAWRGTLDYWVAPVDERPSGGVDLAVAAVAIDGQPPNWPFPGLRATLRAVSWFGGP